MKRIVIFGGTSAIAECAARLWVARGCSVFLVGRNAEKVEAICDDLRVRAGPSQKIGSAVADLNDHEKHAALVKSAEDELGGLDVALIAHGSLPNQTECEKSVAQTLAEINTNALSVLSLLTVMANYFEPRGNGAIVAISSVAGDRGRKSNYVYGAAKGLVTLFMQGLRNRLAAKGVVVVTIKPGFVDTPMTKDFEKKGFLWAKPETIAAGIVQAEERRSDVVYLPWFWRYIMLIIRHIPERIFKRLSL